MDFYSYYLLILSIPLIARAQISVILTTSSSFISPSSITPSLSITPIVTPTSAVTTIAPTSNPPINTTTTISPDSACALNPCQNSATCVNLTPPTTNYTCVCTDGFEGTNCEEILSSTEVDFTMVSIVVGSLTITANSPQSIKDLLIDPSNNVFKTACEHIKRLFMKGLIFQGTFNVRKIICLSFFFASVHSSLVIQTPVTETPTPLELKEAITTGIMSVKLEVPEVTFSDNPLSVTDFNECNTTEGYCDESAICHNLPGSFRCTCAVGFELFEKSICKKINVTDKTGTLLAIIITIVTGGFLLLALVVLVYLKIKQSKKKKKYHIDFPSTEKFLQSKRLRAASRYTKSVPSM